MTGVTFRVKNVRPFKGITIVYKAEFRCQHNTYPDSHKSRNYKPSKQHTGCESTMKVTIKSSVEGRRVRSQDDLRGDYPTIVQVNHNHNHEIKLEDYKGPWRKSRIRPKCSKASPTPPYDSPLVSIVDAREGFTLVKCENPSDPVTTILELPDTVQLLEEPSATTLFVENTHDNICFISQDGEVCYNWKEADNVITNVTTTLANLLKSSFLSHPSQVMDALKRFQDGVNSIETESELFGALHNFGGRQIA
uniref:Uncharacterized protein n=2 Tax=Lygus hesperus TaxID=30085 RepID=A0A0K8SMN7_LYGHE